jgi:hypothetical protein
MIFTAFGRQALCSISHQQLRIFNVKQSSQQVQLTLKQLSIGRTRLDCTENSMYADVSSGKRFLQAYFGVDAEIFCEKQ